MDHAGKIRLLTAGRDLAHCTGVEIGPRDAPLIRRGGGPILYADHAPADELRASLPPSVDPADIVEVDVVTRGGKLADVMTAPVDYIVASHVAEHVPDILGWLGDLHAVLNEGGTVGLAIPDRRFTFDRFRQESTIAEAVEAYVLGVTQPSLRQIFDSAWQSADVTVQQGWENDIAETASMEHRLGRLQPALGLVRQVHSAPRYQDAHCWVFTPHSFLTFVEQACRLGLFPFVLQVFHPTEAGGYEFFALLLRAGPDDAGAIAASVARARDTLSDWAPERTYAVAHASPEIRALTAENAALREALDAVARSRFWRLTGPLRAVVDMIRTPRH